MQKDENLEEIGFTKEVEKRAGSYLLDNNRLIMNALNRAVKGKLKLLDTRDALRKYSWLRKYYWSILSKNKDSYTKQVAKDFNGGYFIRVLPESDITLPLQTCLMMTKPGYVQKVHNIVIVEEGAKLNILSGCVTHPMSGSAIHLGMSEFFIKKKAYLNFTMIHRWNLTTEVYPRTVALLEDKAQFVSNYLCLNPVKKLQMYPSAICKGKGSAVEFNNLIYAADTSRIDIGSEVILEGKLSKGKILSRAIVADRGKIIARGRLVGKNTCKAHLECRGLVLSEKSKLYAIPELMAKHNDSELSHEAAVGKISEKEIVYLMSRGLSRDEAISTIVRGFMDTSILGLPRSLQKQVRWLTERVTEGL